MRKINKKELRRVKAIVKEHGSVQASEWAGLSTKTVRNIVKKGTKKTVSPGTLSKLEAMFSAEEDWCQEIDDPAVQAGEATPGPNYEPDPVMDAPEEPSEPTQQPVPPLLEAVTRAIHEGILEAERGRQPMIHQLQAAVLRLEGKVDLLAKCQLEDMIAWGLRESANGNGG